MEEISKILGIELLDFSELNKGIGLALPEGCAGAVSCQLKIEGGCSVSCD
jgi:hypothetical protein